MTGSFSDLHASGGQRHRILEPQLLTALYHLDRRGLVFSTAEPNHALEVTNRFLDFLPGSSAAAANETRFHCHRHRPVEKCWYRVHVTAAEAIAAEGGGLIVEAGIFCRLFAIDGGLVVN